MTRDLSHFRVNTHELPRRAGEMKEYSIDFDLTEAFGVELISRDHADNSDNSTTTIRSIVGFIPEPKRY